MDKATESAWHGWHVFTKAMTWSAAASVGILILLAIIIP